MIMVKKMPAVMNDENIRPKRSKWEWVLLSLIPILIILAFIGITKAVIEANKKPEERQRKTRPAHKLK